MSINTVRVIFDQKGVNEYYLKAYYYYYYYYDRLAHDVNVFQIMFDDRLLRELKERAFFSDDSILSRHRFTTIVAID